MSAENHRIWGAVSKRSLWNVWSAQLSG